MGSDGLRDGWMDGLGVWNATSVERLEIELLFWLLWNGSYNGTGILLVVLLLVL